MTNIKLIFIVFILFTLFSINIYGWGDDETKEDPSLEEADEDNPFVPETGDEFMEARDKNVPMNVPKDSEVNGYTFPKGHVNADGEGMFSEPIEGPDGELISSEDGLDINALMNNQMPQAEDLDFQTPDGKKASGQNIGGMSWEGPDYSLDYSDYWKTDTHTVFNGDCVFRRSHGDAALEHKAPVRL